MYFVVADEESGTEQAVAGISGIGSKVTQLHYCVC